MLMMRLPCAWLDLWEADDAACLGRASPLGGKSMSMAKPWGGKGGANDGRA